MNIAMAILSGSRPTPTENAEVKLRELMLLILCRYEAFKRLQAKYGEKDEISSYAAREFMEEIGKACLEMKL